MNNALISQTGGVYETRTWSILQRNMSRHLKYSLLASLIS